MVAIPCGCNSTSTVSFISDDLKQSYKNTIATSGEHNIGPVYIVCIWLHFVMIPLRCTFFGAKQIIVIFTNIAIE